MTDLATIRKALKALHRLAGSMRYGGLMELYNLAGEALEALERIEKPKLLEV